MSAGALVLTTALVTAGMASANPAPASVIGAASAAQDSRGEAISAIQAIPAACRARPASRSSTTMNDPTEVSAIHSALGWVIGPGLLLRLVPAAVPRTVVLVRWPSEVVTPGHPETGPRPVLAAAGV